MNITHELREKLQPLGAYIQLQKDYDILYERKQEYKNNVHPDVIKGINKKLLATKKRMEPYRQQSYKNLPAIKVLLNMREYETRASKIWKVTEIITAFSLLALVIFVYLYVIIKAIH